MSCLQNDIIYISHFQLTAENAPKINRLRRYSLKINHNNASLVSVMRSELRKLLPENT